jgi:hypothetical protein
MGYSHSGKIVAIIAKMGLIREIRRKREVFPVRGELVEP